LNEQNSFKPKKKKAMKGPTEQYTDEMSRKFGYYATWTPGRQLEIGDIGTLKDNVFTKLSNLTTRDIMFEQDKPDKTGEDLDYKSQGNVTIATKLSGCAAPAESVLTNVDAGVILEFNKENSIFFRARNCKTSSIKDILSLGDNILQMYRDGEWNKHWVIITELVTAESGTVIISNSSTGKIELKANANVGAAKLDIADVKFDFSAQYSRGLETEIIASQGLTPLFKIMGIKTRFVLPPRFQLSGITALDLVTADTAAKEYKEKLYFGYVSAELRE
jgi:hypothetical protein